MNVPVFINGFIAGAIVTVAIIVALALRARKR